MKYEFLLYLYIKKLLSSQISEVAQDSTRCSSRKWRKTFMVFPTSEACNGAWSGCRPFTSPRKPLVRTKFRRSSTNASSSAARCRWTSVREQCTKNNHILDWSKTDPTNLLVKKKSWMFVLSHFRQIDPELLGFNMFLTRQSWCFPFYFLQLFGSSRPPWCFPPGLFLQAGRPPGVGSPRRRPGRRRGGAGAPGPGAAEPRGGAAPGADVDGPGRWVGEEQDN